MYKLLQKLRGNPILNLRISYLDVREKLNKETNIGGSTSNRIKNGIEGLTLSERSYVEGEKKIETKEEEEKKEENKKRKIEIVELIPIKVSNLNYPNSEEEFGEGLAGIMDAIGYVSKNVIEFTVNIRDINVLKYISKRLEIRENEGTLKRAEKESNGYRLKITSEGKMKKILLLIEKHIKTNKKIDQINKVLLINYPNKENQGQFKKDESVDLETGYGSGFGQHHGCCMIKCGFIQNKPRTVLEFKTELSCEDHIDLIIKLFSGYKYYRKSRKCGEYNAQTIKSIDIYENYFKKYNMLTSKHTNYLKGVKVLSLKRDKEHLTLEGRLLILQIKKSMNNKSYETLVLE